MELVKNNNGKEALKVQWAIGTASEAEVGQLLLQLEQQGADIRFIVPVMVQTKVGIQPSLGFTVFARKVTAGAAG
jgi:hypothetical protein